MSNTPTPATPETDHPPGSDHAWGGNLKFLFDSLLKRAEELDNHFDKLTTDAQSAANLALLNAVDSADKLSKATILNLTNAGANANQEQASQSDVTIDDIGKVMASSTEQLAAVFTTHLDALTAQIMALTIALTGRPPVTAPAVEGSATNLGK